jgi:hypothetical protein
MGGKTRQRQSVRMRRAEQLAEANLCIQAVADVAPADLAAAVGLQQKGVDSRVHGLFLMRVVWGDKLKAPDT